MTRTTFYKDMRACKKEFVWGKTMDKKNPILKFGVPKGSLEDATEDRLLSLGMMEKTKKENEA